MYEAALVPAAPVKTRMPSSIHGLLSLKAPVLGMRWDAKVCMQLERRTRVSVVKCIFGFDARLMSAGFLDLIDGGLVRGLL